MFKTISILTVTIIILSAGYCFPQSFFSEAKPSRVLSPVKVSSSSSFIGGPVAQGLFYTFLVLNPIVTYGDKKFDFGFTKEISLAAYPLGRFAFEYSYIFRSYSQNHFRFSYNYDFYKAKDFVAYGFSSGAGYFTDTKYSGYFFQASYGLLIPAIESMNLALHPYLKLRYTVIPKETVRNFADLSLGVDLFFYTGL